MAPGTAPGCLRARDPGDDVRKVRLIETVQHLGQCDRSVGDGPDDQIGELHGVDLTGE